MRPVVRLGIAIVGAAALLPAQAFAQSASAASPAGARLEAAAADALIESAAGAAEAPDEITVKGKKDELAKYRLKMTQARDKVVETFNRVNSDDHNDITCRTEKPTGSRLGHSVCRSKAEDAADANAAKGFLTALVLNAGNFTSPRGPGTGPALPGGPQVNAAIETGNSQQGGAMGEQQARANLEAELKKMMEQNRQLYRAVLEYVDAKDNYNKARGAGPVILDGHNPLDEATTVQPQPAQP